MIRLVPWQANQSKASKPPVQLTRLSANAPKGVTEGFEAFCVLEV